MSNKKVSLSIVIPLYNEEESLLELAEWIDNVCKENKIDYETIYVDDGSTDQSWQVIQSIKKRYPNTRAYRFQRNYGKSAALNVGFRYANGDVVITMDADLQDSPNEIPSFYHMIIVEKYDMVSGWKRKRYDPISKTVPSKLFNKVTSIISGIKLHDFNCGLKAYKKEVVKTIDVYGEMHRYIPYLAKASGYKKIGEKIVEHKPRKYGKSKFGVERFINGFLDLLSLTFILRFGRKPMHFFGTLGIIFFVSGFFITLYVIIEKLTKIYSGIPANKIRPIVEQPLFYLALVALISGLQLFLSGFLGELIIRSSSEKHNYLISEVID
jgi:glycosyltransferase involved in cell wall biosynthesis